MLSAYFDESEVGNRLCIIGGVVSTADKWVRFAEECEALKREFQIPYFHSVKLFNPQSQGIYKHLDMTRRCELVSAFTESIVKWTERSVVTTISPQRYNALTTPEWRRHNKTYYAASFHWMLIALEEIFCDDGASKTLSLFIESGHKHEQEVLNMLKDYKMWSDEEDGYHIHPNNPMPLKIGSYGASGKATAPPLWAADILSYSWARRVSKDQAYFDDLLAVMDTNQSSCGICIDTEKIELLKRIPETVKAENKLFYEDMHHLGKILYGYGIRTVKDKRGVVFDMEGMTKEQQRRFSEGS